MPTKFCPKCKRINESSATVCVYCEASFEDSPNDQPSTARVERDTNVLSQAIETTFVGSLDTPEHGIAFYLKDYPKPIAILDSQEFVIGRAKPDTAYEGLVDLTPYGGYENGVSQKHAMIRQTDSGYEILDLGSTNGTWLDRQRLVPNQPHPLNNGAQIHLGRLSLYIIYHKAKSKSDGLNSHLMM